MRLLILGGTTQASALSHALAGRSDLAPVLSFAGRTEKPVPPPIPFRVGGFGGIYGLREYIVAQDIDAVIDATHPFAEQMSRHAAVACEAAGVPFVAFTRPEWELQTGDDWTEVDGIDAAVAALGAEPRRVFLTQGRLQLAAFAAAPWHTYLVRAIDPPAEIAALPRHRLILARGPFGLADELALMRGEGIEILVTKNSGGAATYAKIEAARQLGVKVIMLRRPAGAGVAELHELDQILAWIEAHRPAL